MFSVCPDFSHHNDGWKIKTDLFFSLKTHLVTHFHKKKTLHEQHKKPRNQFINVRSSKNSHKTKNQIGLDFFPLTSIYFFRYY